MSAPVASPPALSVLPPNRVRYAGREGRVGAAGWVALDLLLRSPGNRVSVAELCRAVWGREGVHWKAVEGLLYQRVNGALRDLRCPRRAGVDAGSVVLV